MDLSAKKVIVTGGMSGLGRAIVEKLISNGAVVTIFDIATEGFATIEKENAGLKCVACDVADYAQVVAASEAHFAENGVTDVLINNAGILHSEPLVRITDKGLVKHDPMTWDRVLRTDLSSVFYVTGCIVEKMIASRTKGVVVNISSIAAAGNPGASAYSAAKAGVNALTASWSRELGPLGIRVVAVAPGFIDTESAAAAMSETALRETIKKVPLRRLGKPEEVADAVIAVIQNDFFNGKVFELDGGLIV